MSEAEIDAVCLAWYGPKWNAPEAKDRPGEKMKDVWRDLARKAVKAVDQIRTVPSVQSTELTGEK